MERRTISVEVRADSFWASTTSRGGIGQDLVWLPHVLVHHGDAVIAFEDCPAVRHRDRVDVHIDDPGLLDELLGNFVDVANRGDA